MAKAAKVHSEGELLRIKVVIRGIKPAIWRRLVVPAALNLAGVHVLLQVAFGWGNCHLHAFKRGVRRFLPMQTGVDFGRDGESAVDESTIAIIDLLCGKGGRLVYQYDMGDFWEHEIVLEYRMGVGPLSICCLDGARSSPPEDCGGAIMFKGLLSALSNPKHPDHDYLREWVGCDFDSEAFDRDAVNSALGRLKFA
jgi:hypothetical protein